MRSNLEESELLVVIGPDPFRAVDGALLDRSVLHGTETLQPWHYFAGGEELYLKLFVGGFGDRFGQRLGSAVQRIKRFRQARRHAPFDFGHRLRDRWRRQGGSTCHAYSSDLDKVASLHGFLPPVGAAGLLAEACLVVAACLQHGASGSGF